MRMYAGAAALVTCALVASCAPTPTGPHPTGTLEPRITASSAEPTSSPPNDACKLLTAEEREDVGRMSMDAEIPVHPVIGTHECIWTHAKNQPARSAIRVIAANGETWARQAGPPMALAINHPSVSKSLAKKLRQAMVELASPATLSDERICELFLLFTESRGMHRSEEMLFAGTIGSMPAAYAASCEDGVVVLAGFGEHGLRGSIALKHVVFRLVEAANDRVGELFSENADAGDDEAAETDSETEADPGSEDPEADAEDGDEQ